MVEFARCWLLMKPLLKPASTFILNVRYVCISVNNLTLKLDILLDKNGSAYQTGELQVVLDGMSVNMRYFPRRLPQQTTTPVANGPASANTSVGDGNTTPRSSQL